MGLFGKNRNCPLDITAVQKVYNRAKQKSGVEKGKGIHTLRHCFATHLLEGGVDLVTIKTLLGHNSLQSTQRYLQIRQPKLGLATSPLDLLDLRDPRFSRALSCCLPVQGWWQEREAGAPNWPISFVVTGRATNERIAYRPLSKK